MARAGSYALSLPDSSPAVLASVRYPSSSYLKPIAAKRLQNILWGRYMAWCVTPLSALVDMPITGWQGVDTKIELRMPYALTCNLHGVNYAYCDHAQVQRVWERAAAR